MGINIIKLNFQSETTQNGFMQFSLQKKAMKLVENAAELVEKASFSDFLHTKSFLKMAAFSTIFVAICAAAGRKSCWCPFKSVWFCNWGSPDIL